MKIESGPLTSGGKTIHIKSVAVVVLNNNKVLLHQREDFRIWTLPGGNIESDETWQSAAVRETYEETGYEIEVDRLVGEYWQPQMPNGGVMRYVCTGCVIGGKAIERGPETLQVNWFDVEKLPFSVPRFAREYIDDTKLSEDSPLKKIQTMPKWQAILIKYLLQIRDFRNWMLNRP